MGHEKPKFFGRLGGWFDDAWIDAGLAICSIVFAGCCLALSSEVLDQIIDKTYHPTIKKWAVKVILVDLIASVIFWIANRRRAKRITSLEKQVATLSEEKNLLAENVVSLIEGFLVNVAFAKLGFGGKPNCSERISLFSHDEAGQEFILVGRYSPNPTHHARRRSKYPENEGCLARAWQTGSDFLDDLPDPGVSLDDYAAQQEAASAFPAAEARQLIMKSRLYYAYRVMDTRNRKPVVST
ncbi:MAG TPA: hypothetical protein VGO56_15530 [Pyrinomonadaceae bacterium]|jgi:hypothetical protein|nr:hypothetical protein [Pyrinomonadaceae bacterium]